ncbi:hypothetical protein DPEC_G00122880 [Dallia pectoralis]|uniref:Uncharacterized protein n=1 Tax=Dallia pectoralis TaxID=75939 RepID=A0ACC2GR46_DALPE|nr:hypothetical protein DPEC_G00122880 [Dallia pectoralis]
MHMARNMASLSVIQPRRTREIELSFCHTTPQNALNGLTHPPTDMQLHKTSDSSAIIAAHGKKRDTISLRTRLPSSSSSSCCKTCRAFSLSPTVAMSCNIFIDTADLLLLIIIIHDAGR